MMVRMTRYAIALCVSLVAAATSIRAGQNPPGGSSAGAWITVWGTSQQALSEATISNAAVRLIARVTAPGETIRLRLDNTFGADSIRIGRAHVGLRIQGAQIAAGTNRPVTFNQAQDAILPPGGTLWSDPIPLKVLAQQDLAVSLYIPGSGVRASQHSNAVITSYRTPDGAGDAGAQEQRTAFTATLTSTWWLKSIEVQAASGGGVAGAIVAFGDSITDGTCATLDAHDRWVDVLSVRLGFRRSDGGAQPLKAVVNEGIGGNTVTRAGLQPLPDSLPGIERLDRDVLSHHGVTDVIVFMGTNDLRREATVAAIQQGFSSIVTRIKAKGIRVTGVTIIPRHNVAPSGTNTGWNAEKTRRRNEMNTWIRTSAGLDHVIDFDSVVRNPSEPDLIQPAFNCGDGIHPSPAGYFALGQAIPLTIFDSRD
jgi:lysophospholipase L1-like esterase